MVVKERYLNFDFDTGRVDLLPAVGVLPVVFPRSSEKSRAALKDFEKKVQ